MDQVAEVGFDELLTIIATTPALGWVQLNPSSVARIKTHPGDQLQVCLSGHESIAYLRSNLDAAVAWGAEQNEEPWEGIWTAWSTFPDESVRGMYAKILRRGRPVYRQLLVVADGGRHYLPSPTPIMAGDDVEEWVVEQDHLPLARLVDGLEHSGSDIDATLRMLEIRVRS